MNKTEKIELAKTLNEAENLKTSELFKGLNEKIQIIATKKKDVEIFNEGNTGEIKKISFKQKKRPKISFYGSLIDLDLTYIIK